MKGLVLIDLSMNDRETSINIGILNLLDNIRFPVLNCFYEQQDPLHLSKGNKFNMPDENILLATKYDYTNSARTYNNGKGFYIANNRRHDIIETSQAIEFFKLHQVSEIYICGKTLPGCVYNRPTGFKALTEAGYKCSVIIDLTDPGHVEALTGQEPHSTRLRQIHIMYRFCKSNNIPICYADELYENI